ncbi:hypothetical protein J6590_046041, partial [Homalodisca vitripennis]
MIAVPPKCLKAGLGSDRPVIKLGSIQCCGYGCDSILYWVSGYDPVYFSRGHDGGDVPVPQ